MTFDPWLYVALAAGFVVGQVAPVRSPWVGRATLGTVAVLVGLLGASLDSVAWTSLVTAVPLAVAFALVILGLTAAFYLALARLRPAPTRPPSGPPPAERAPITLALLAALLAGFALGRVVAVPYGPAIPWVLYVLLALVGFGLHLELAGLREVWRPLSAAVGAALVAALLFAIVDRLALGASLATTFGFGFYSFAGPLVAARLGAVLGLLAFLTNFLREDLTMLLSPYLGPRLGGGGLAALGGATSMDTTLYFVTRYGDRDAGSLALANGLVLTVVATLVLPAILAVPL